MNVPERESGRLWSFPEGMLGPDESIKGFEVEAADGDAGKVAWATYAPGESYLVISLSRHLRGTHHVVPAAAVARISIPDQKVWLHLPRAEVERAPEHNDESQPLASSTVDAIPGTWSTFLLRG